MGVSSELPSTVSKLEVLPCSTRAGRQGPLMASSNFLTNLKRVLRDEGGKHQHNTVPSVERGGVRDVSPVGLLHRLLDGPETDVVPLGDLDKVLKTRGVSRAEDQVVLRHPPNTSAIIDTLWKVDRHEPSAPSRWAA